MLFLSKYFNWTSFFLTYTTEDRLRYLKRNKINRSYVVAFLNPGRKDLPSNRKHQNNEEVTLFSWYPNAVCNYFRRQIELFTHFVVYYGSSNSAEVRDVDSQCTNVLTFTLASALPIADIHERMRMSCNFFLTRYQANAILLLLKKHSKWNVL